MNRDLNLTSAQRDKVGDIMRDSRFKVIQARRDYEHERHQLFWKALTSVRGVLTPEQQAKFDREFSRPWAEHDHGDDDLEHHHGEMHGPADPPDAPQPAPSPR